MTKMRDGMEQELKFELDRDCERSTILSLFEQYGKIWRNPEDESLRPVERSNYVVKAYKDIYMDTSDYCLAINGASYRVKEVDSSNKVRVNFKFPGEQRNGIFVRREVVNYFKQDAFDMNRLQEGLCEASRLAMSFAKEHASMGSIPQHFDIVLHVTTQRMFFTLETKEWGELGRVFFDASTCYSPASTFNRREYFELEFELNPARICRRTLAILDEMSEQLLRFGLLPSRKNKYARGLELLGFPIL